MSATQNTRIKQGWSVSSDRRADRNTQFLDTLPEAAAAKFVPQRFLDDGYFVAEYWTGYRVFFKLTDQVHPVRNWDGKSATDVEFFEILTVVEDDAIWGVPGESKGFGMVRTDSIVRS